MSDVKKCTVEGCKRAYRAKGFCNVHFHKWRKGELKIKSRYKTCGEENCNKPQTKFGMCEEHHSSWIASKKVGTQTPAAAAPAATPAAEQKPAPEPAKEAPPS